jgi:hypothetical protein
MRILAILPILLAGACGGSSGNDNPSGGSADAAVDSATGGGSGSGATIKISGIATLQSVTGPSMASGVTVAAYANSDEATVVAMATTDANGSYTLNLPTGTPLDGFLMATKTGIPTTYLYPQAPLSADFDKAAINMVDSFSYSILTGGSVGNQTAEQGMIALLVVDSQTALNPIPGAAVTSSPAAGATAYSKVNTPIPDNTAAVTLDDGRAFLFRYAPGTVTVMATKQGTTFKPTTLKVHKNAFTTTLITP